MIVAHEAFFNPKKFMSKKHAMAMKHDVHKAYDWVEWSFFRKVLFHFGSIETWINRVMQCMTTINYSILINSVPSVLFSPSRELRQRDSLSPYIFLSVTQALSSLIANSKNLGLFEGLKLTRHVPVITHILFANDTLLFGVASKEKAMTFSKIIKDYSLASGENVNFQKSSIMFNRKCLVNLKHDILPKSFCHK